LDADKEGFLRSETSLVQTIGRAARNSAAQVVLYADRVTGSMQRAMDETDRRRKRQVAHNEKHGITPQSVLRGVYSMAAEQIKKEADRYTPSGQFKKKYLEVAEGEQEAYIGGNLTAVLAELEFEEAARLRDEMQRLKGA